MHRYCILFKSHQAAIASVQGVELLAFIEHTRYDEATNLMGVEQSNLPNLVSPDGPGVLARIDLLEGDLITESVPSKILQIESGWGAVVKRTTADGGAEYSIWRSDSTATAIALLRTTAEAMAEALRTSTVTREGACSGFRFKARLVCSDRYAAQLAAERGLCMARREWAMLHTACEIHMSTSAQAKALLLIDGSIMAWSGLQSP